MTRSNEIKNNVGEGYAWILFEVVIITIHMWVTGTLMGKGDFAVILPLLISGLSYTRLGFLTGIVYIIGREIYSQGYRRLGSKGCLIGALILDVVLLVVWSMALYTCFYYRNGFKRLILQ